MKLQRSRILIIEDVEADARYVSNFLVEAGYEVIVAQDGNEGLKKAFNELPDLILMDIVMPGINGFQATRQLSCDPRTKDIPVVMVSGKEQETDKVWALKQGAKAYLTKRFRKDELYQVLDSVLENSAENKEMKKQSETELRNTFTNIRS